MIRVLAPLDEVRSITEFRMYARRKFYPDNRELVSEYIRQAIPTSNVMYNGDDTYLVLSESEPNRNETYSYYWPIEEALLNLYEQGNILGLINSDDQISDKEKYILKEVYEDMHMQSHQSRSLKMMFDLLVTKNSPVVSIAVKL